MHERGGGGVGMERIEEKGEERERTRTQQVKRVKVVTELLASSINWTPFQDRVRFVRNYRCFGSRASDQQHNLCNWRNNQTTCQNAAKHSD